MSGQPLSPLEKHIAKRLEVRRKLLGISEVRMAFVMAMTEDEYRRLEAGEARITGAVLSDLAFLLGVPVLYFLTLHKM